MNYRIKVSSSSVVTTSKNTYSLICSIIGGSKGLLVDGLRIYCECFNQTDSITVFKAFTSTNCANSGRSYRKADIVCDEDIDTSLYTIITDAQVFMCDSNNDIEDIPSGDAIGLKNDITAFARTYNLTHQKKDYIETINVSDIVTEIAQDNTTKHRCSLTHVPTSDMVHIEINGTANYEGDDFTVDRENKIIYFDTTSDDGFDFAALQESTSKIRVFYKYKY